jgi:hypothetical protein
MADDIGQLRDWLGECGPSVCASAARLMNLRCTVRLSFRESCWEVEWTVDEHDDDDDRTNAAGHIEELHYVRLLKNP